MSRQRIEPTIYHNQELMDNTNDMFIRIKTHLFNLGDERLKSRYPKPSNEELDQLINRLFLELRKDNEPMIKR